METIENKVTKIKKTDTEFVKFSDLAFACVNVTSQSGFSIQEMKARIRLTDILENAKDIIELEDADYNKLKELVNTMNWGIIHKDIVEFVDILNK